MKKIQQRDFVSRSWDEGELVVGEYAGYGTININGRDVKYLIFATINGMVEKWETTQLARFQFNEGVVYAILFVGQVKGRFGRRINKYEIGLLTADEWQRYQNGKLAEAQIRKMLTE
jgi:hypothetical protein